MISLVQLLQSLLKGLGERQNALCVARIYKHANIHLAMVKRMKYVRIFGCGQVGQSFSYTAIWPPNSSSCPLDR